MINHNMELKDEPNDLIRNANYSVIWYKQYTHIVFRKDIWQPKFSFSPFQYTCPHTNVVKHSYQNFKDQNEVPAQDLQILVYIFVVWI
jgi:hypothetical protein